MSYNVDLDMPLLRDEKIWLRAWMATAQVHNSTTQTCDEYADHCLRAFKDRF